MSDELTTQRKGRLLEAAVVIPNVLLLVLIVSYLLFTRGNRGAGVEPVVRTDPKTAQRIAALEREVRLAPKQNRGGLLELARLYSHVGELPWSVDALRSAEREGSSAPVWRLKLGLAYLEIGYNLDGLRVLKAAMLTCGGKQQTCSADVRAKLEIATRVAERLIERKVNAREQQQAAAKIFDSVLKQAQPQRLSDRLNKLSPTQPTSAPASQPLAPASQPQ
ncbi:MAG: hypothetical protein H6707_16485 [Deltaproteobacteria bacterium]|nr:hypothetical protein [Deltaproteobacteria bacterium]